MLAAFLCSALPGAALPAAGNQTLVVTSTNGSSNQVVVFKLDTSGSPSLSLVSMLPTGGSGGAPGTTAGSVQFSDGFGAVVNYGSNSVSQLVRTDNSIVVARNISLTSHCNSPVSTALSAQQMFVVGANCAESFSWPAGFMDGFVALTDNSAAQIVAGQTWAAVTLTSGSVLQLPLTSWGSLAGTSTQVALPSGADSVPLGAAFWGDLLGFNPAHSPNSFALLNHSGDVFPVLGPQPAYPSNAPCWLTKGPGNLWYSGNSPGKAISIFFSDDQGGVFYKSVLVPGTPTDITVSPDRQWLAVIYAASGEGYVAVFAIDRYGDLSLAATSSPIGASGFAGVAFSQ